MPLASSSLYNGRLYSLVAVVLMAISLTFLIVGVSLHNLYSFDASSISDEVQASMNVSVSGSAHFGAFYSCIDFDGLSTRGDFLFAIHTCHPLPSDCKVHFSVYTSQGDVEINEEMQGFTCSQYNAFRAFLVIGIILLGGAMLLWLMALPGAPWEQSKAAQWGAVGLLGGAVVAVVISYGLVASHMQQLEDDLFKFHIGPAFALCVTAWCLMVITLFIMGLVRAGGVGKEGGFGRQMDKEGSEMEQQKA